MSNKCTPLWRKAHFQFKMYRAPHVRSTFGSWDVEKVYAFVARSTFPSQNVQSTPFSDHFWKLTCRESARRCGAKHISKSKVLKTDGFGSLLDVQMWFCLASARKGFCTLSTVSKTWGFCSMSKNDGRRGTFQGDLQRRCISRGRRSTRDMFIRDTRRSGRWFPERGCILEHQIFRFAKVILRDRCSTSYDPASLFRGSRNTLNRWNGKIAKRNGTSLSALHSTFHFWRKSRRIASFLMLPREVSKNCCVFFCCRFQQFRKSRRLASFLMLSSSNSEEFSQNSFVFKLADRQIDR